MTSHDQEVCMCKYHQNVELLATGIHRVAPGIPCDPVQVAELTVCDLANTDCVDRKCLMCGVDDVNGYAAATDTKTPVSYYQWTTRDGKTVKTHVESDLESAITELRVQLKRFARHLYDDRRQHAELRRLKETIKPGEVIIQEDFSENFAIKHQSEIMSAHWSSEGVTIFTVVVYFRQTETSDLDHFSFSVVSDELIHDKKAVYANNSLILQELKMLLPWDITTVHYWSDGAASQFKNRYNFMNIAYHERDFDCAADWSFFCTAHGKGPVDGVGGETKRVVWRAILQGKATVTSPREFYEVAKKLTGKIGVLWLSSEDIKRVTAHLDSRFEKSFPVAGTHSVQYLRSNDDISLAVATNSPFTRNEPVNIVQVVQTPRNDKPEPVEDQEMDIDLPDLTEIKVGDFCLVKFHTNKSENKVFLGQCTDKHTDKNEKVVKFAFLRAKDSEKTVFAFKTNDNSWVDEHDVVAKLDAPVMDNRDRYMFDGPILVNE